MSIRVDKVQLQFEIDTKNKDSQSLHKLNEDIRSAYKSIRQLEKKHKELLSQPPKNKASQEYKDWKAQISMVGQALQAEQNHLADLDRKKSQLINTMGKEKMSIHELQNELKQYNILLSNLTPGTESFNKVQAYVKDLKRQLTEYRNEINNTQSSLSKFIKGFNEVSWAIQFAYQGAQKVVQWADQYVQSFAKMDEAMTDVMKYTGQTKQEVEEMNETFKRMETRTAREELNALAGAAGRLGITARKDIEGFVSAADKINVALGDDLGEGAIDQIGKLTMVFGEDKKKGLEGAMLATGSAINVLGASSSANTGFITEFTSRMAGMAVNARISQTDIMGYASALSQAGIEGETASGVFAQMITKMFTDPAKFAKAAGLEVKAFTNLLKTDANQAILQFLEGLKSKGGFDSLAPALKSLQMQGTQAVPVISSLINKMDELKQAQQTAATAYEQGTSIIDEFNNANSSAAARLDMAKAGLNDVAVELGQKLMPIVEGGLVTSKAVLQILSQVAGFVTRNIATLSRLAIGVGAYTAAIQIATNATKIWAAVTKATPWGLVLGGIAAVLVAFDKYKTRLAETRRLQEELNKVDADATTKYAEQSREVKRLDAAMRDERTSIDERRKALDRLKAIIPDYNGMLNEEGRLTRDNKKAIDDYLVSLQKQIRLKAYQDKLEELYSRQATQEEEQRTASDKYWSTRQTNTLQGGNSPVMSLMRRLGVGEEASLKRTLDAADKSLADTNNKITTLENRIKDLGGSVISATESTPEPSGVAPGAADGDSGSTKSDSELKKEVTAREKQRKELEAQAKAAYEADLLHLKELYQGRKNLQDEWHGMELKAEERYLEKVGQIRKDHGAKQSDIQEWANSVLDLKIKQANHQRETDQHETDRKLESETRAYNERQVAEAQKWLNGEYQNQEMYDQKMLELEIEHQRKMLEIKKAAGLDTTQAELQLLKMEIKQRRDAMARQQDDTDAYHEGNNVLLHSEFDQTASFDKMRELTQQYYDDGLISYQQYQANMSEIAQAESDKRQQIEQAAQQAIGNMLNSASQLFSAMQQRETAEVDAKYKKLIASAKKSGKDTTKLEEQMQAEKDAIAKKYAQKQFMIQVLQIVANTAQGVMKTIAELGMPWAIPFVAMTTAAGAMQLAAAKSAADQASGLYEGGYSDDYQEGYTEKGNPREQAGVIPVHKNEFVANHKAVANPEVRPVLDVIDRHQKAGDIHMLNSTRMLEEAYGSGRYRGGYTHEGDSLSGSEQSPGGYAGVSPAVMDLLTRIADNTGQSLTVRKLREEIRHEERLESRARR